MSSPIALRSFRRALARWPQDTLRPDVSFSKLILAQKELRLSPPKTEDASKVVEQVDAVTELEQANALCSLLENRYSNKFKISKRLLEPQSAPTYYKDLLREFEEAPKRSWLGRQLNKWKGSLRFS